MAGDLIRDVRRAVLILQKGNAGLTALVPAASIHPSTVPVNPAWPFTRFDGGRSVPLDGRCYAGATVAFLLHAFAKPRFAGAAMIETAEDHCSRIATAMKLAVHLTRVPVADGTALIRVRSVQIIQDSAEADAYHAILSCEARALVT
jgi:hypothetical protein